MTHKKPSIKKRLQMLIFVCLVPLVIAGGYLLLVMNRFSQRYDAIVENITLANNYNMNFKDDMDYIMYMVVANSERAKELVDTEQPYEMISEARESFQKLYDGADSDDTREQLRDILKCLDTLHDRVTEIEQDSLIPGTYDKNMESLDLNIRVLTELIQDKIQKYIYYETTNLESLREGIRNDVVRSIQAYSLIFAVILFGALLISRRIMNDIAGPIQSLCSVTEKAANGDFTVRAKEADSSELAVLNDSFNRMVEQLGTLVEDIRVEQLNQRSLELKVLQEQINPHFLYNTLDAIIWLAESGQTEQVVEMVSALSNFFRTSLSKGRDYVTVAEEESHIRSYLEIQQFRYRDILDYEIHIPEEIKQYSILKLTLQPLVENALYHGIKNKRVLGHIVVSGEKAEENLVFTVKDDGIGMSEDQLAHVRRLISGEDKIEWNSSGFGLSNVNQRLQLNYGSSYGVSIDSSQGQGTVTTVIVPAETGRTEIVNS
ncbi:MAG: sensor histidine kinase [Lachnospiraceae bacterium]|jgi:two-component system sensor histidine kinase YesM|nr:sensor histidine kinase [Lachnospiraceae bacterium]